MSGTYPKPPCRSGRPIVPQRGGDGRQPSDSLRAPPPRLADRARLLEATLASIPDFVYAFDHQGRFVYANPAMQALFGLPRPEILGKNFADLGYPAELTERLNSHINVVLRDGVTVEDEVFYRSPTGLAANFAFLWGPVRADDGSVELVVGVSRDTTKRHALEEALRKSEARLRAAIELVGLGVYAWDPVTGALDWDERLRAMWGLQPDSPVDMETYEAGIDPHDLARVRQAIAGCVDPTGDGVYHIEYRVTGRDDGVTRHIATAGRTLFVHGTPVDFVGAAIDVSSQRNNEAAVRASEAQFRSFADHSSNLIWISEPAGGKVVFRSTAFDRIWGIPREDAPTSLATWLESVHPNDREQVERALAAVGAGEVVKYEYRIVRPGDGKIRRLRDTSFPIFDEKGLVSRIGGIAEDVTPEQYEQIYVVGAAAAETRHLTALIRSFGYQARSFDGVSAFLNIAPVLSPGCVVVDLRGSRAAYGLAVPRELKARSIALPTILLAGPGGDVGSAVTAMKTGATDYLTVTDDSSLRHLLAHAVSECSVATEPVTRDETAAARVARLSHRERQVLLRLVEGETNKVIGQHLGISPRTVELHRAQVMNRLNAANLSELLQIALAAGLRRSAA